jgi:hypothetical protein
MGAFGPTIMMLKFDCRRPSARDEISYHLQIDDVENVTSDDVHCRRRVAPLQFGKTYVDMAVEDCTSVALHWHRNLDVFRRTGLIDVCVADVWRANLILIDLICKTAADVVLIAVECLD